jgi:hypothetical protein
MAQDDKEPDFKALALDVPSYVGEPDALAMILERMYRLGQSSLPQPASDKEMVEADIDARIARIAGETHPLFQASLKYEMLDLIRRSPADDTPKGWRLVKIADLATILALLPPKPLVKNGLMYMCADAEPGDRLHQIRDAFDTMLSNAPPAPGSNG